MHPIQKAIAVTALAIAYLKYIGESLRIKGRKGEHKETHGNAFVLLSSPLLQCNLLHTAIFEYGLIQLFSEQLINVQNEYNIISAIERQIRCETIENKDVLVDIQNFNNPMNLFLMFEIIVHSIANGCVHHPRE